MDQQLRCTQEGHENKLIDGICMDKSCQADQRILCMKCLKTNHAKCQNQFCDQNEFIQRLIQLKTQVKEFAEILQLREVIQAIHNSLKVFEQIISQKFEKYQKYNLSDTINNILKNQHILSSSDWMVGYELLTGDYITVTSGTKRLIDQLIKIKQSLDQITKQQVQNEDKETPINSHWNHITVQNPLIINTKYQIFSMALSPNGQQIASASEDEKNQNCIWNLVNGQQVKNSMNGHANWIYSINYSKCGEYIVSCSGDLSIRQWCLSNYQQFGQTITEHSSFIYGVEYSPDQRYIISCSYDKTLKIWDQITGTEFADKQIQHTNPIYSLSLSPIKNEVAFGDNIGTIIIWDYETHQQCGYLLRGHSNWIFTLKYSNDGKLIVSGSSDKLIILWNAQTKTQIRQFSGHSSCVRSVNFSPNQKYIISGGNDKKVILWDRVDGKSIACLTHHQDRVWSTQFSLCGNYIITGGWDKQIRIMIAPIQQSDLLN